MNPGELNKRVSIKETINVSDGGGGYTEDHKTIVTVWGKLSNLTGREIYRAKQMDVEITNKITIRYRKDIKRDQVVFIGDRKMDIQYILNQDEKNKYLNLFVLERM